MLYMWGEKRMKASEFLKERMKPNDYINQEDLASKKRNNIGRFMFDIEFDSDSKIAELLDKQFIDKAEILQIIKDYQNPYPKDVFKWDNKEKLNFNRGRFNQHCFEIVENTKKEILKDLIGDEK